MWQSLYTAPLQISCYFYTFPYVNLSGPPFVSVYNHSAYTSSIHMQIYLLFICTVATSTILDFIKIKKY